MKKIFYSFVVLLIVCCFSFALVACNADSYESKFEKAGYVVVSLDDEQIESIAGNNNGIEWVVFGIKTDIDFGYVIKFENVDDAKEFELTLENELEANMSFTRINNLIIFGSKAAVIALR